MSARGIAIPASPSPSSEDQPEELAAALRLRAVLDSALDCIILVDAQGRILDWNPAAELTFGHTRAEVMGRLLPEVIGAAAQLHVLGPRAELTALRKDGTEFPAELSRVQSGGFSVVTVRDASERKREEAAWRDNSERPGAVARATKDIIWLWDLASGQLICNEAAGRTFRYPPGQIGETFDWWCERIHAEDRQRVTAGIRGALARQREAWADEYRFLRGDGSYATVLHRGLVSRNQRGEPLRMIGSFVDLTERRHAETVQMRLAALVESSQDAIIGLTIDGLVEQWNRGAEKLLGYSAQEANGRSIVELITPEDKRAHARELVECLRRGDAIPPFESVRRRKDGRLVDVSITLSPIPDASGQVTRFSAILRDISERKRMQAQLEQAERLASVGTLAAGVAHEINNPLAYVMANLGFAVEELQRLVAPSEPGQPDASGPADPKMIRELLDSLGEALQGTARVKQIVRDLKLFARADEERVGPVDVQPVIDSSINIVWGEIRHRARLTKDYGVVPAAQANQSRLGQVMINLLVNAAHAIREGAVEDNEICVRTREAGRGWVAIEVSDTGSGIPPQLLPRIFDPFFTTKPVGVGTGLGLAICHGIVTALGGEIQVSSVLGQGSTFRVLLPGAGAQTAGSLAPAPKEAAPVTSAPARERRPRVLVIDDEPVLLATLTRALGKDFDLTVERSGRAALARLEQDDTFDHILCDLMMPELTGMDLYEQLCVSKRPVARRIVFMTGGVFTTRARDFLGRVPNRLIEKPFSVNALREALSARSDP
ncbi:MAG TPA: PAS domain S-box protein [Polyangia bacterium]|nr:PAS domain S-box protein [Polyangia bacterium]